MTRERLFLYDTTLRDGQQTQGVDFSAEDKGRIAEALDGLGIDYVEGGWPGANPTDSTFFEAAPTLGRATMTAFGMTKRAGRSAANDEVLAGVVNAGTPAVCLVGKTHDFHVATALGITLAENLDNIRESLVHLVSLGREALFDAEHFFDGYRANPGYALDCLRAARDAGARWIVLCDTNGGTLPAEVRAVTETVIAAGIPGAATVHANSARDALVRLCALPLLAGRNIDASFVQPAVASSVHLVVHCVLDADGRRRVAEIIAPTGRIIDGEIVAETLYSSDVVEALPAPDPGRVPGCDPEGVPGRVPGRVPGLLPGLVPAQWPGAAVESVPDAHTLPEMHAPSDAARLPMTDARLPVPDARLPGPGARQPATGWTKGPVA